MFAVAATIAEFLEKDMLPESRLCSRTSEQLRRLLKARTALVRTEVVFKNQIHALLTAEAPSYGLRVRTNLAE